MYRCKECHAEYDEYPDFCDCGNDEFEEIIDEGYKKNTTSNDEDYYNEDDEDKLTPHELAEIEEEKLEKKKSSIAVGISIILCILILILPPHIKQKPKESKEQIGKIQIPSVNTFWDDTLPNVPLLNEHFAGISPKMREYLVMIGRQLNTKWSTTLVDKPGECLVQFIINKEGRLDVKTIISSSGNQNLDDSVSILLTNTYGFRNPPADYNGEKIYILFKLDKNGVSKVSYPSYSK